jgi:hypothetical protein
LENPEKVQEISAILFSIIAYIGGASTCQTREEEGEKEFTAMMADRIGKRMCERRHFLSQSVSICFAHRKGIGEYQAHRHFFLYGSTPSSPAPLARISKRLPATQRRKRKGIGGHSYSVVIVGADVRAMRSVLFQSSF